MKKVNLMVLIGVSILITSCNNLKKADSEKAEQSELERTTEEAENFDEFNLESYLATSLIDKNEIQTIDHS